MTSAAYDVIVIGGGHNSLAAALVLAKAGRKVVVVERRDGLGGLSGGRTFHPGYTHTGLLPETDRVDPATAAALGLEAHGLAWEAASPLHVARAGRAPVRIDADPARTAADLATTAPKDAEAWRAWNAWLDALAVPLRPLLTRMPPSVLGRPDWFGLARTALGVRSLGAEAMLELLRSAPLSARDLADERFSDPAVKVALVAPALFGTWMGPWSPHGAAAMILGGIQAGAGAPRKQVRGGGRGLIAALVSACRAAGVELRENSAAEQVVVESGRVAGVMVRGGDLLKADRVLSGADPRTTLLGLVDPIHLPVSFIGEVSAIRCRGVVTRVHLAVEGPIRLSGTDEAPQRVLIGEDLRAWERAFEDAKHRRPCAAPALDVRIPSVADPSLAPQGGHVLSIGATGIVDTGAPAREVVETVLAAMEPAFGDLRAQVRGAEVLTPALIERDYGTTGGHLTHGEWSLDQVWVNRPSRSLARFATPIGGLFLCSGGGHPGGGNTLVSGVLAARAALAAS